MGHMTTQNKYYFDVQLYYWLHMIVLLCLYNMINKLSIQLSCIYPVIIIMIMLKPIKTCTLLVHIFETTHNNYYHAYKSIQLL